MNIAWNICSHPTWSYGRILHERKPGKIHPPKEGVAGSESDSGCEANGWAIRKGTKFSVDSEHLPWL